MTKVPIIKKRVKLLFGMELQYMSKSGVIQVMHRNNFHQMFSFENMNPLKQRKSKKDFSFCKTFLEKFKNLENFGEILIDVIHCVFQYAKAHHLFFCFRGSLCLIRSYQ